MPPIRKVDHRGFLDVVVGRASGEAAPGRWSRQSSFRRTLFAPGCLRLGKLAGEASVEDAGVSVNRAHIVHQIFDDGEERKGLLGSSDD